MFCRPLPDYLHRRRLKWSLYNVRQACRRIFIDLIIFSMIPGVSVSNFADMVTNIVVSRYGAKNISKCFA